MNQKVIKNPKQKRSIEKKNKIIEAGMTLIVERGYHNTTTDDIASAAGVSTGIVYRYFHDKKDILLEALTLYFNMMLEHFLSKNIEANNLRSLLEYILDNFIDLHMNYRAAHDEIEALRHSDKDVQMLYNTFTDKAIERVMDIFQEDIKGEHFRENIYLAYEIMEGFCHYAIKADDNIDLSYMRDIILTNVEQIILNKM